MSTSDVNSMEDLKHALLMVESRTLLTRETGINKLATLLEPAGTKSDETVKSFLQEKILNFMNSEHWESRHGGLFAAKVFVQHIDICVDALLQLESTSIKCLEDNEYRVRIALGEFLRTLATKEGISLYLRIKNKIFKTIENNLDEKSGVDAIDTLYSEHNQFGDEIHNVQRGYPAQGVSQSNKLRGSETANPESAISGRVIPSSFEHLGYSTNEVDRKSDKIMQEKESSSILETSLKILKNIGEGTGVEFHKYFDAHYFSLLKKCTLHENRFVREASFDNLNALFTCFDGNPINQLENEISKLLSIGLKDDWSQVRYSASIATKTFLSTTKLDLETFFPTLLPPMCFNRYFIAEGVRIHSQETWRSVMKERGREMVAKYADHVISHYLCECASQNRMVRESACHCIEELLSKVDKQKVSSRIVELCSALVDLCQDDTWRVRGAACRACGRAILEYPAEISFTLKDKIFDVLFMSLVDGIHYVREDSAYALGNAIKVYQREDMEKVLTKLKELLPMAKIQTNFPKFNNENKIQDDNENEEYQNRTVEQSEIELGIKKSDAVEEKKESERCSEGKKNNSKPETTQHSAHECQLKHDHILERHKSSNKNIQSSAWHASDGAIYLLREISTFSPDSSLPFLPTLSDLGYCKHFPEYPLLLENLYNQLPTIASNLGKKKFKPFLELFIEPLFFALTCGQATAESSAKRCITKLQQWIGPSIFNARLTDQQLSLLNSPQSPSGPEAANFRPSFPHFSIQSLRHEHGSG